MKPDHIIMYGLPLTVLMVGLLAAIIIPNYLRHKDIKESKVPSNLEETFVALKEMLSEEDLKNFRDTPENELSGKYHFGLGLWMRNNWGLWSESPLKDYFNEMGIFHPDDMSGIIITSFHRHLNGKNIRLKEQIKYYQEYWGNVKIKQVE